MKLALICAIIGTVVLVVLSESVEVTEANIDDLKEGDDDKVSGVIKSISNRGNATFLEIETVQVVKAVAFDPVNVSKGARVELIGTVQEYEGSNELIVQKIVGSK